jgi:hypothetical protein
MHIEREHLLPLASEGFKLAETSFPVVGGQGCVKVRTNRYSVRLWVGSKMQARLVPSYAEVCHEQRCVPRHERNFDRYQAVLDLEHYLDMLERRQGALARSTPLQSGERAGAGRKLRPVVAEVTREARQAGGHTRDNLATAPGPLDTVGKQLTKAVEQALAQGCTDAA